MYPYCANLLCNPESLNKILSRNEKKLDLPTLIPGKKRIFLFDYNNINCAFCLVCVTDESGFQLISQYYINQLVLLQYQ